MDIVFLGILIAFGLSFYFMYTRMNSTSNPT